MKNLDLGHQIQLGRQGLGPLKKMTPQQLTELEEQLQSGAGTSSETSSPEEPSSDSEPKPRGRKKKLDDPEKQPATDQEPQTGENPQQPETPSPEGQGLTAAKVANLVGAGGAESQE
ncbi:MAG: hypothetical protein ACK47B_23845 [Armatimonadota bacterium]